MQARAIKCKQDALGFHGVDWGLLRCPGDTIGTPLDPLGPQGGLFGPPGTTFGSPGTALSLQGSALGNPLNLPGIPLISIMGKISIVVVRSSRAILRHSKVF